jgi:hypothetical protein
MPQQFAVDNDLVELVWDLAEPRPFENLSFNTALRRVLIGKRARERGGDFEVVVSGKKTPSPSASAWVASVPELKNKKGLTTWQAICDYFKIDTAGDSARRRLKNWVKENQPGWPPVPSIRSQADA